MNNFSNASSWLHIDNNSDFSIYNLPVGIFSTTDRNKRIGVAIGDHVLDLAAMVDCDLLQLPKDVVSTSFLNDFISLGASKTNGIRQKIQDLLLDPKSTLRSLDKCFVNRNSVQMHLPVKIGDYTDFYSSIEHATNLGKMFRDPDNALLPNWKHIPVGYHGRSSSITVSGTPFHRPKGQVKPKDATSPIFTPTQKLDFELEMAMVIGKESALGQSVSINEAQDYIFGLVLFNDWSARDIQKWEYVPLGPFLGKSFCSTISPWVVPVKALENFKVPAIVQEPEPLGYLKGDSSFNYDIHLEVELKPQHHTGHIISKSNTKYLYWSMQQQIAHHTVNGCNLNIGDMMASGTISGKNSDSYGSMIELTWGGKNPIHLPNGLKRTFIEDFDTLSLRGFGIKDGMRVGFGSAEAQVLPAN